MRPRLLILLCAYLTAWVPLNAAALASSSLPSLDMRGAAAAVELAAHLGSAALCAAAGWMLWNRSPAGGRLASIALCVNAAVALQGLHVSALPRDVPPGLSGPLSILTLVFTIAWLGYLQRSRRFRAWLE